MTVVTPAFAAAAVPEGKSSLSGAPGSMKWTWVSIIPGITNKSLASTLSLAGKGCSVIWATLPSFT